jgi:hypothetical protein
MTSENDEQRPLLAGNDGASATTEERSTEAGSPTFSRQLNAFNGFALLISVIIGQYFQFSLPKSEES